nr:hypothetical protein [Thalassospira tepidiphila]
MIKALLREIENPGTGKTQTRRAVKGTALNWLDEAKFSPDFLVDPGNDLCPYGKPGDLLYVRETWSGHHIFKDIKPSERGHINTEDGPVFKDELWFWADGGPKWGDWEKPRPGIHMPRWASRITLEVTDVRVERLQSISEEDAIAEGVELMRPGYWRKYTPSWTQHELTAKGSFVSLFKSIHGPDIWKSNPWLWAVTFVPHLINVDRFIEERAAA